MYIYSTSSHDETDCKCKLVHCISLYDSLCHQLPMTGWKRSPLHWEPSVLVYNDTIGERRSVKNTQTLPFSFNIRKVVNTEGVGSWWQYDQHLINDVFVIHQIYFAGNKIAVISKLPTQFYSSWYQFQYQISLPTVYIHFTQTTLFKVIACKPTILTHVSVYLTLKPKLYLWWPSSDPFQRAHTESYLLFSQLNVLLIILFNIKHVLKWTTLVIWLIWALRFGF